MDTSDINMGHDDIIVESECHENTEKILCLNFAARYLILKKLGIYMKKLNDLVTCDDHFSKLICV